MSKSPKHDLFSLAYHPEAAEEGVEAKKWYARRSEVASINFQVELDRAAEEVRANPLRWEKYKFGTRRFIFSKFPYLLVYRVVESRIDVLAIAHGRRKPGYWRSRLRK